jgi:D-alanyl-D-alanine carboxypeptidase
MRYQDLVASKTGTTDLAGGNLVVAFDPEIGRPIVISVLGSTEDGRFTDMEKLVSKTLSSHRDKSDKHYYRQED